MNVHILGKGLIPGLKMLAPVRNVDLDQQQIARILKVRTLKVILADSPDVITKNNIAQIFANQGSVKVAASIKKNDAPEKVEEKTPAEALIEKAESAGIETEVIKEEATPVEASVDDITLAEGLLDEALEVVEAPVAPAVKEEAIDESEDITEEESEEEEVEETSTATENQNPKKKNKKNRHNK
jgi:hypothetical protein